MNILVTDHYTPEALGRLSATLGAQVKRSAARQPTADELQEVEVLLIRSRTKIDKTLLEFAPRLRLIVTSTSGFDHIDLELCRKHNIIAMYTPEAHVQSVAELTLLLMLNLQRRLVELQKAVNKGEWKERLDPGEELGGKTLGIIGLGRIGSKVARLASALDMHLIGYDPYIKDQQFADLGVERLGLTELLKMSDILTLHAPLTSETRHIINKGTFELINHNALLINTARGGLVNENDLVSALERDHIRGAALDVFEHEPLGAQARLLRFPQLLLTPHIGAFTNEAFQKASQMAVQKVIDYFKESITSDILPPNADWCQGGF